MKKQTEEKSRMQELRDALKIDKNDLDNVLVEQPVLFSEVADQHALAVSRRDEAEAAMKEVAAMLDHRLRRAEEKPSEAQLKNMVISHKEFREAQDEYLRKKRIADRWWGLKESYSDRNYMLKELAGLYVSGYYMNASAGRTSNRFGASDRIAEQNKEAAGKLREKRMGKVK